MSWYQFFVDYYNQFLAIFPPGLQWLVTLAVLIGLVGGFVGLLRRNLLYAILLILILPAIFPVIQHFFMDVYHFFLYLINLLGGSAPNP